MKDLALVFISKIKEKYPSIQISYIFDEENQMNIFYHNNEKLAYETPSFQAFIGHTIREVFFLKGIYNVTCSYNYEFAKKTIMNSIPYARIEPTLFNWSIEAATIPYLFENIEFVSFKQFSKVNMDVHTPYYYDLEEVAKCLKSVDMGVAA